MDKSPRSVVSQSLLNLRESIDFYFSGKMAIEDLKYFLEKASSQVNHYYERGYLDIEPEPKIDPPSFNGA